MDKEVGCLSLCPHESLVPKTDVCPGARLEEVAGQCCKVWVCAGLDDSPKIDMDRFWDELVDDTREDDFSLAVIPSNDLTSINPGATTSTYLENALDERVSTHMNNLAHGGNKDFASMGDGGPVGDDILDYQIAFANHRRKIERGLHIPDDADEDEDYDEDMIWEEFNDFIGDDDNGK